MSVHHHRAARLIVLLTLAAGASLSCGEARSQPLTSPRAARPSAATDPCPICCLAHDGAGRARLAVRIAPALDGQRQSPPVLTVNGEVRIPLKALAGLRPGQWAVVDVDTGVAEVRSATLTFDVGAPGGGSTLTSRLVVSSGRRPTHRI